MTTALMQRQRFRKWSTLDVEDAGGGNKRRAVIVAFNSDAHVLTVRYGWHWRVIAWCARALEEDK